MSEKSLLQETAERLTGDGLGPAIVVSSEDQSSLVERQLADAKVSVDAILLEIVGRNTAAAAALAAMAEVERSR
jgi:mannose-1-phosphate guanylyltransferase